MSFDTTFNKANKNSNSRHPYAGNQLIPLSIPSKNLTALWWVVVMCFLADLFCFDEPFWPKFEMEMCVTSGSPSTPSITAVETLCVCLSNEVVVSEGGASKPNLDSIRGGNAPRQRVTSTPHITAVETPRVQQFLEVSTRTNLRAGQGTLLVF